MIIIKIDFCGHPQMSMRFEHLDVLRRYVGERVNLHVNNMLQRGQISQSTCNNLINDTDTTQQFYLLPKYP